MPEIQFSKIYVNQVKTENITALAGDSIEVKNNGAEPKEMIIFGLSAEKVEISCNILI